MKVRSSGAFPGTVSFFVALVFPSFASNSDSVTADLLFLAPGSTFIGNDDGTSFPAVGNNVGYYNDSAISMVHSVHGVAGQQPLVLIGIIA